MSSRRRWCRDTVSAMLASVLGLPAPKAHAGYNIFLNEYTASRDELQAELARRFPVTRRMGELAAVSLHDPRLSLDAKANRATLTSRLAMLSPLLRPDPLGGQVAVSSGLRWDAATLSVRLQDPRMEQLRIDGVVAGEALHLERVAGPVAQEALQGLALHTFQPGEIPLGLKVRAITIGADEVKVQFE
jgi:hypothetical protein